MAGVFLGCSLSYILSQGPSLEIIRAHEYDWSSWPTCPRDPVFASWVLGT